MARKGDLKDHHFAHKGSPDGSPCRTGPETALHKFAKEVLADRLELVLPAYGLTDGEEEWIGYAGGVYAFDAAVLESRLGEIIPDVIVRKGDRDLLVEFRVTHECGPEKIARIKAMDIATIEVDLSELPRDISRQGLEEAILKIAPRDWLHNPKLRNGEAYLNERRLERQRVFRERAATLRRDYAKACAEMQDDDIPCRAHDEAAADGLGRAVEIEVPGFGCFLVPPCEWQATMLMETIEAVLAGKMRFMTTQGLLGRIERKGWVRKGFSGIADTLAAAVRAEGTQFATPLEAVSTWVSVLSELSIVESWDFKGRWILTQGTLQSIQELRHRRARPNLRMDEIQKDVKSVLSDLPEEELAGFSLDRWAEEPLPGREYSITEAVHLDGPEFDRIRTELTNIDRAIRFSPKINIDLMGLPLAGKLARRLEEKRREEEAREVERQENARRDADARGAWIISDAQIGLGIEGNAWTDAPNEGLGGRSPVDAARESAAGLVEATKILDALLRQRETDARKTQVAEKAREELRRKAAKVHQGQYLDLYLNTGQPTLGGKSPSVYSVDEATMRKCVELTLVGGKRRR
ncbi:hypothetical protein [Microvirga terricola]|uniref:Uncharacterized protein n=1 Tax=Microvirga terricola TaxID=2719797 RepID=A0ABX0VCZ4_9HYPH|nr:hypothetical protein [Microvirga terricola]NIX77373.1 hypothetical protein [Microvirga terricola]